MQKFGTVHRIFWWIVTGLAVASMVFLGVRYRANHVNPKGSLQEEYTDQLFHGIAAYTEEGDHAWIEGLSASGNHFAWAKVYDSTRKMKKSGDLESFHEQLLAAERAATDPFIKAIIMVRLMRVERALGMGEIAFARGDQLQKFGGFEGWAKTIQAQIAEDQGRVSEARLLYSEAYADPHQPSALKRMIAQKLMRLSVRVAGESAEGEGSQH